MKYLIKFWKWWNQHRPSVMWWFWVALMTANLAVALLGIIVERWNPEMNMPILWPCIMAVICVIFVQIWGYFMDNPDKYEEFKRRRVGRTRRGAKKSPTKKKR